MSPILDLFCTLLHLGVDGWTKLLADRQALMPPFRVQLAALAERHGERLLHTPNNTISMAITLSPEAGGLCLLWPYLLWLYLLWLNLTMALLTMALPTMALLSIALLTMALLTMALYLLRHTGRGGAAARAVGPLRRGWRQHPVRLQQAQP